MRFEETLLERTIQIGEANYKPLRLGAFIKLEFYKNSVFESIKKLDKEKFIDGIKNIIKLQTERSTDSYKNIIEIYIDFFHILSNNTIKSNIVFLTPPPEKKEYKEDRWNFDGRIFAQWIDVLAKTYGWDIDKILDLDVNMAVYLIQEILVNQQFEKEFTYSLSELAYRYDPQSKKSNFQPLHRPYWMEERIDVVMNKPVRMLKKLMPHGVISIAGIETPNAVQTEQN